MTAAYLSLGSNLGDRVENLRAAVRALDGPQSRLVALSPIYETKHVGDTANPVPDYLNCAARVETDLAPRDLLHYTRAIEDALGRERPSRWAPRTLDIDLLLVGDEVVDEADLQVPHPRLAERAFVLMPLVDIAPDLRLPDGRRAADLAADPTVLAQAIRRRSLPDWPATASPGHTE